MVSSWSRKLPCEEPSKAISGRIAVLVADDTPMGCQLLSAFFRSWQPIGVSSATRTAIRPLMAFDGSSLGSFRDHDDIMLCTPQKHKQSRYALIAFQPARGGHRGEGPGKGAPCL